MDELTAKVRGILDEVFRLMEQQMLARPDSISATETHECKKRAERINYLLCCLIDEAPHRRSKEMSRRILPDRTS
jgi:hypothetical protein